jgi:hypothetical protein
MKYSALKEKINALGINPRFTIDIASVAEKLRPFGLIHVDYDSKQQTIELLNWVDCKIAGERDLFFSQDSESREVMLYDVKKTEKPTHSEIWFTSIDNEIPIQFNPFDNPGKHLGYPACCVSKYENSNGMGVFYKEYLFSGATRYNEINRLCTLFYSNLLMPDFFPCSLSCVHSRDFAILVQSLAELIYTSDEITETKKYLSAPLLIFSKKIFCFPEYKIVDDKLYLLVDDSTQSISLGTVLNEHYWQFDREKNLLIKFKNVENIRHLFIYKNSIQEEIKFDFI